MEAAVGRPFAPPRSDLLPCMLFTTEELSPSPVHLPLFAYLLLQSAHHAIHCLLRYQGFELRHIEGGASLEAAFLTPEPGCTNSRQQESLAGATGDECGDGSRPRLAATGAARLSYWYRPALQGGDAAFDRSTPVVFLHGSCSTSHHDVGAGIGV